MHQKKSRHMHKIASKTCGEERYPDGTLILIMLIHHSPTAPNTLYFTIKSGVYNVMRIIWQKLTDLEKERLLFIHDVTGCDTVSAIFGQGKVKLYKKLVNAANLGTVFENMLILDNDYGNIVYHGIQLFKYIFGDMSKSLTQLRVRKFHKMSVNGTLKPEYLPPTDGSVEQHILRAHLQYHDWLLLNSMTLPPTEYGWKLNAENCFEPIATTCEIVPQ